jgi:CubicO group peptidase (beta-lactamase class C family)
MRKKLFLSFLICLLALTASGQNRPLPPPLPPPLPTIDQVLERYVQAIGGEAAWRKLTTRVSKGTLETQDGKLQCSLEVMAQAPNRQLIRIEGETANGVAFGSLNGFDGATGWKFDLANDEFSASSRAEAAAQRIAADFYLEIKLKERYPKRQFDGVQVLGTRRAYVITATPVEGPAEKWYFDALTGLLSRTDRLAASPGETVTMWFDDYRAVDGIKLPFTIRTSAAGAKYVSRFAEIKHNVPLEAARFSMSDPALAAATTDEYLQAEMKKRRIPGLALAVVKNGEVVKVQGYGLANLEHDAPVTPETVFELASVTKQFTATAIMRLSEQGKLKLDDPINKYLPDAPSKWNGITIRHLLTHTGGIVSLEQGFADLSGKTEVSTEELFRSVAKDPLSFAPGERHQYSDAGYFLLGMIIEKVSGQRYRHFLREQFFNSLAMTATSILDQWAIIKHRAAGYMLRNGELINIRRIRQNELPSHFGVLTNVRDLARWDIALAAGKVVSEASLQAMWTPAQLNHGQTYPYGFGWEIERMGDHRLITHSGVTGTEYTRLPDDHLTVIILSNLGYRGLDMVKAWGLTKGVARRYLAGRL